MGTFKDSESHRGKRPHLLEDKSQLASDRGVNKVLGKVEEGLKN